MKQDISSLMDGELGGDESARVIRACCSSEEHKDTWNTYHVIGEAIRGQAPQTLARRAGVMAALAKEPTILAPRTRLLETTFGRIALAAAASVATVGVVSWIGTQGGAPGVAAPTMVKVAPSGPAGIAIQPVAATAPAPSVPLADGQVQDYLNAHRQIPAPDSYRSVANRGAASAR
jgi:sigma-E factor negative regulatory protein RseA